MQRWPPSRVHIKPVCANLPEGTRVCYVRADHAPYLTRVVLPLLHQVPGYSQNDIVVANFGQRYGSKGEYRAAVQQFIGYVSDWDVYMPHVMWMQTPAQHYATLHGDLPSTPPAEGYSCAPLADIVAVNATGELIPPPPTETIEEAAAEEQAAAGTRDEATRARLEERQRLAGAVDLAMEGGWRNVIADEIVVDNGVPLVPLYNESVPLYGYHRVQDGQQSCMLYCFPSVHPQGVYSLYRVLRGEFFERKAANDQADNSDSRSGEEGVNGGGRKPEEQQQQEQKKEGEKGEERDWRDGRFDLPLPQTGKP